MRIVASNTPTVVRGALSAPRQAVAAPYLPPVHFFAEADVAPGAVATLRSEALSNRTGRPVDIHEIRLSATGVFENVTNVIMSLGGICGVRLSVNDKPITNSFVPIWLLGKVENRFNQIGNILIAGSNYVATTFVWRLSRPWHVPPGAMIAAQFQNSGGANTPITGRIGLAGKFAPVTARTSAVPFAAAYVSKSFAFDGNGGDPDFDTSSERDLVNVTGRVLNVDRIIGRFGVIRADADDLVQAFQDYNDSATEDLAIRMNTSGGIPIIKDYTPIRHVFGYYPSAIEEAHMMAPGDYYSVEVRKNPSTAEDPVLTTYQVQAYVSVLGCREETI